MKQQLVFIYLTGLSCLKSSRMSSFASTLPRGWATITCLSMWMCLLYPPEGELIGGGSSYDWDQPNMSSLCAGLSPEAVCCSGVACLFLLGLERLFVLLQCCVGKNLGVPQWGSCGFRQRDERVHEKRGWGSNKLVDLVDEAISANIASYNGNLNDSMTFRLEMHVNIGWI